MEMTKGMTQVCRPAMAVKATAASRCAEGAALTAIAGRQNGNEAPMAKNRHWRFSQPIQMRENT